MPATSVRDYLSLEADSTVWVWKGIIPVSGSALLFGDPKCGKSMLTLGLCEAVADPAIDSYLGLAIPQHGKVLYLQLDTPRNLWRTGYLGILKSDVCRDAIYLIDKEMSDLPKAFDIRSKACMTWLRAEVDKVEPVLVVVDTVRRMHKGVENDSDVMTAVHDAFQWATKPAALLYITHKKKPQQGDSGPGRMRGNSAFEGAVDALVSMSRKALRIDARSDVDEEIDIIQEANGRIVLNTDVDEKMAFIHSFGPELTETQKTKAIMEQFGVSERMARNYKRQAKEG